MTRLPPDIIEQPVEGSKDIVVQIAHYSRERSGIRATLTAYNGHVITKERGLVETGALRERFKQKLCLAAPSLQGDAIETALLHLCETVSQRLDAVLPEPATATLSQEDKDALWKKAQQLAESTDILGRINGVLSELGVVGEHSSRKILYLAGTARLLEKPVSVFMKGPSGSGKTFLVTQILRLFPESAFVNYTSISPHFLAYSTDELANRIVVIYEANGLDDGFGVYLIRSLLSEGRIEIGTVDKADGALAARKIVKEGPTALFTTTTQAELDAEIETRALTLTTEDSPAQSRAILCGTAAAFLDHGRQPPDLTTFHSFQEWLQYAAERRVVIPFAQSLAEKVPNTAVRIRRDFSKLLSLIAAHALLYQAQRPRTADNAVIACLDDYTGVRDLLNDAFISAQQDGVTSEQRTTVESVAVLQPTGTPNAGVSVTEIAKHLGRDKSTASRRLSQLTKKGYLQNLNAGVKGAKAAYIVGEPLPEELSGLPLPAELTEEGSI